MFKMKIHISEYKRYNYIYWNGKYWGYPPDNFKNESHFFFFINDFHLGKNNSENIIWNIQYLKNQLLLNSLNIIIN